MTFDGTLAKQMAKYVPSEVGKPIPKMVLRVRSWLKQGKDVRIFTARVSFSHSAADRIRARHVIKKWCKKWIGQELPITNAKDANMVELWDDRAVSVRRDTGEPLVHTVLKAARSRGMA